MERDQRADHDDQSWPQGWRQQEAKPGGLAEGGQEGGRRNWRRPGVMARGTSKVKMGVIGLRV